jgi:hypothetical protein
MDDWLRLTLALLFFCLGIYLCIDLYLSGFDLIIFMAAPLCFTLAHILKPKQRDDDAYAIIDAVDIILDIPYRAIALALRGLGRLLRGDIDSVDL